MTSDATGHVSTAPRTQTWKWTSDAFAELQWLDRFGDQGWEVERVDALARFVGHRPTSGARRWEYRRETVGVPRRGGPAGGPAGVLAADGWEPCGSWVCFEYFKRPKAEGESPLDVLPPVPSRHVYWSRRFLLLIAVFAALAVAAFVS
jgi:hypothetical protein